MTFAATRAQVADVLEAAGLTVYAGAIPRQFKPPAVVVKTAPGDYITREEPATLGTFLMHLALVCYAGAANDAGDLEDELDELAGTIAAAGFDLEYVGGTLTEQGPGDTAYVTRTVYIQAPTAA